VSKKYRGGKLDNKYETICADYLLGKTPFPRTFVLLVHFIVPDGDLPLGGLAFLPETRKRNTFHIHQFGLCGLFFQLYVGNILPPGFTCLSFTDTKRVLLSFGDWLFRMCFNVIGQAAPDNRLKAHLAGQSTGRP
jgi:hypothetical protein